MYKRFKGKGGHYKFNHFVLSPLRYAHLPPADPGVSLADTPCGRSDNWALCAECIDRETAGSRRRRYVRLRRSAGCDSKRLVHGDDRRKACRTHGRQHRAWRHDSGRMPYGDDWRINRIKRNI